MRTLSASRGGLVLGAVGLLAAAGCGPRTPYAGWPDPDRAVLCTVRLSVDAGTVSHRQESALVDLKSDWSGTMVRPRVAVEVRTRPGLELAGDFAGFQTTEQHEYWELGGAPFLRERMKFSGTEFRALAGWGFDVEDIGHFAALGGLSGRSAKIERRDGGTWDADMYFAEGEARAELPLPEESLGTPAQFRMSAAWGWLLEPEAKVEGAGTIEGDQGWILRLRAGLNVDLSRRAGFYLGGFWEKLDVIGDTKGAAEWPDSDTKAGGGEVGVSLRF